MQHYGAPTRLLDWTKSICSGVFRRRWPFREAWSYLGSPREDSQGLHEARWHQEDLPLELGDEAEEREFA